MAALAERGAAMTRLSGGLLRRAVGGPVGYSRVVAAGPWRLRRLHRDVDGCGALGDAARRPGRRS